MEKLKNRKIILINPRFQLAFMAYMVITAMVMIGIFYGANIYFINEFREMGQSIGLASDHVFFEFLDEQNSKLTLFFAVSAAVAFVMLCLASLFMSHRVAGPLYRLSGYMQDICEEKDVDEVKFRKRDFFPELAEGMNSVMRRYRANNQRDKD
jgi:signal transduction histidine kinase